MSEQNHTPGPWHYQEGSDPHTHIVRTGEVKLYRGRAFICQLATDASGESRANARLIAAAPDLLEAANLLEAAEDSRQYCDECEDEGEPEACGKCFPKFDDARIRRRLAIAKAEGRAAVQSREGDRMTESEQELRAALDGVLSIDDGFLPAMLAKFEQLRFLPIDPALQCASLRAPQKQFAGGAIGVYFSPGGRVLKVMALFGYPTEFSSTITYRLPRDYWPKKTEREAFTGEKAAE